jgi:hypothetical protein
MFEKMPMFLKLLHSGVLLAPNQILNIPVSPGALPDPLIGIFLRTFWLFYLGTAYTL